MKDLEHAQGVERRLSNRRELDRQLVEAWENGEAQEWHDLLTFKNIEAFYVEMGAKKGYHGHKCKRTEYDRRNTGVWYDAKRYIGALDQTG